MGAALCMWVLRAWKIGQIEQIAGEQEKRSENRDAASAEPVDETVSFAAKRSVRIQLNRLFIWKKV